jgi:hypothetical protein
MPQKYRLKTRPLPNNLDVVFVRQTARPFGTLRIALGLIFVKQYKAL